MNHSCVCKVQVVLIRNKHIWLFNLIVFPRILCTLWTITAFKMCPVSRRQECILKNALRWPRGIISRPHPWIANGGSGHPTVRWRGRHRGRAGSPRAAVINWVGEESERERQGSRSSINGSSFARQLGRPWCYLCDLMHD